VSEQSVTFMWRQGQKLAPTWVRRMLGRYIDTIEQQMGVRFLRKKGDLILLGCGVYGCVIALEDVTRVFKITSDEEEGPLTAWVQQLQRDGASPGGVPILQTTTKIDRVFRFPEKVKLRGYDNTIFGIVREGIDPHQRIPKQVAEVLDSCVDGWEMACISRLESKQMLGRLMASSAVRTMVKGLFGEQARRLGAHLKWFQTTGTPFMDIHRDNVAFRINDEGPGTEAGQIVMFDFGASQLCDKIPGEIIDLD